MRWEKSKTPINATHTSAQRERGRNHGCVSGEEEESWQTCQNTHRSSETNTRVFENVFIDFWVWEFGHKESLSNQPAAGVTCLFVLRVCLLIQDSETKRTPLWDWAVFLSYIKNLNPKLRFEFDTELNIFADMFEFSLQTWGDVDGSELNSDSLHHDMLKFISEVKLSALTDGWAGLTSGKEICSLNDAGSCK